MNTTPFPITIGPSKENSPVDESRSRGQDLNDVVEFDDSVIMISGSKIIEDKHHDIQA